MPNVKTQQNKQTKKTLAYKASNIKIPSAFSETRQANTVRWNIENVERKKTSLARNLYPVKLHFKTEREIKGFSDQKKKKKQNNKKKNPQFDASRLCFERNIKGVLKRRKITYIRNTIIQKEKMSTGERIVKKINLFIPNWLYKKQFNIIIATVYLIMYLVCIHICIYV